MSFAKKSPEELRQAFAHYFNSSRYSFPEELKELKKRTDQFTNAVSAAPPGSDVYDLFKAYKKDAEWLMGDKQFVERYFLEQNLRTYDMVGRDYQKFYFKDSPKKEVTAHIQRCDLRKQKIEEIQNFVKDVLGLSNFIVSFEQDASKKYTLNVYTGNISYEDYYKLHRTIVAEICKSGRLSPADISIFPHDSESRLK